MKNSLELTLSAIKGVPEKIPFNPFIMHLAAMIIDANYNHEYCQNPEVLANGQIRCAEFFGVDHVNVSTDAYREASAWGVEINWESHTPVAKNHIKIEDFESIDPPDITASSRMMNRVKAVERLYKKVGDTQCIVGWIEAPFAEISCLFGLINVLMLSKHEDWDIRIKKLISRILPIQEEFAKMQIEVGAHIIGAGDSAISQIGPMRYEKCCLEATKKLFTNIKSRVPILYHTCGNNAIVDKEGRDMIKLISSSGADIIDFDYQVDLDLAKRKIGSSTCIRGNSNTQILGSEIYAIDAVYDEVRDTILRGKPNGKYMFSAGCEWPWYPLAMASRNLGIAKSLVENIGTY
jgi:uroporphyrinogen-III decarboxylase